MNFNITVFFSNGQKLTYSYNNADENEEILRLYSKPTFRECLQSGWKIARIIVTGVY